MAKAKPVFRRVVLKISGEGLAGPGGFGIGGDAALRLAEEIRAVRAAGVEVAVVVGGGNLIRGATLAQRSTIPAATAHQMGMLATAINALALHEVMESIGVPARVMSALEMPSICESYIRRRCIDHLSKGRVVILAGGTGRPFVTTDTAAALAAVELQADALLKATQVDGVYSADPKKDRQAEFYPRLSYDRVIDQRLKVMDISAVDLCQRGGIPIVVFSLHQPGNLKRVITGKRVGTIIAAKA